MRCYHIHITGRVQGVGFRPFIYRIANQHNLSGWVSNSLDGVHIEAEGNYTIHNFCQRIRKEKPPQAQINEFVVKELPVSQYEGFSIRESSKKGNSDMQITPDFAICRECLEELNDKSNRRFAYPFITCTNCGPRFSITKRLPYDRHCTTMASYKQCDLCYDEFQDPLDRRFYSQTNSCSNCPIEITLYGKDRKAITYNQNQIITKTASAILSGKIIAIKGIGGYLLCGDATSSKVINTLRKRKRRPFKPFALMYPDIKTAKKDVFVSNRIINSWRSPESPIVLCPLKKDPSTGIINGAIAPGLKRMGIMLPYAPLFVLLMDKIQKPIIATSGNVSGSPIIFKDDEGLDILSHIADMILVNDREIVVPQDDSVIQYTMFSDQKIILRRSRGLAPSIRFIRKKKDDSKVLAMGAMLKSAFGILHWNRYYISQYLGDTSTLESQNSYDTTLAHMTQLLNFSPSTIITDLHPDYPSTELGVEIASRLDIPVIKVQHHEAHSLAVLGENDLLNKDKVLAVVWDGTGYGKDGHIWGGEFFDYSNYQHTRIGHWAYFPHILGDKMIKEPRISAFCVTRNLQVADHELSDKFQSSELANYKKILNKGSLYTSSVGRIFDAVSSLLGLTDINNYEGEAAMYLEAEATCFLIDNPDFNETYKTDITVDGKINSEDLLYKMLLDKADGKGIGYMAAKFHNTTVDIIKRFLEIFDYKEVVFSGGVFQNGLLVDLIIKALSDKYSVYFHKDLSPNDECIPFGQLMAWEILNK